MATDPERTRSRQPIHRHRLCILSLLCGAGAVIVFGAYQYYYNSHVTRVEVSNVSDQELREVVLHVSGKSYAVGTVAAQSRTVVHVVPQYESHLEIEFISHDGNRRVLDVGGYFGPGIPADIWVEMDASAIRSRDIQSR